MKVLKRFIAILMCVVLTLTAAPLQGFVGLDLLSIFTVKAMEATDVDVTDRGTCGDNLTWTLYENGELVISGTGYMDMEWVSPSDAPWYSYSNDIKTVNIGNGVKFIGCYAFYGCDNLTSVTIGNAVIEIGQNAFAFCDSLKSVSIPNSVMSISYNAFYGCDSLTSITIPHSVISISTEQFCNCDNLTNITVDDNNQYYSSENGILFKKDKSALLCYPGGKTAKEYTIPDYVTDIGEQAFSGNAYIETLNIPESVTTIGDQAFYGCDSLTSITIPDNVTVNGKFAFADCDGLISVTIGNGLTSIGSCAFYDCDSLTSITIPDNVTTIGDRVFAYCDSLTSVTIPDSVIAIGEAAFNYCNSLTDVHYNGTQSQWAEISIDTGNDSLTSATVHFLNDEESTTEEYTTEEWTTEESTTEDVTQEYIDEESTFVIDATTTTVPVTERPSIEDEQEAPDSDSTTTTRAPETTTTAPSSQNVSGTCGENLAWTLNKTTGLLTISGTGEMWDFSRHSCATWYENRYNIKTVIIDEGVTTIGAYSFYGCYNLSSIVIPNSVRTIGTVAFGDCGLTDINIPQNVTSIGDSPFISCNKLNKITVDASNKCFAVDERGVLFDKAFTHLISYPCGNTSKEYKVPDTVLTIGNSAFSHSGSNNSFSYGLSSNHLETIILPENITKIGDYAFWGSYYLKSVNLPDSVTTMGRDVFDECRGLVNVEIGSGITAIDTDTLCFNGCENLEGINVSDSNNYYCSVDGVLYNKDKSILVRYPCGKTDLEFTIPYEVTVIGGYSFYECNSIESVTIGNNVTGIKFDSFSSCKALKNISIGSSVEYIDSDAFSFCDSLQEINVDESNKFYCSVDGVLFDKNKTELIQYPVGNTKESYTISDSVTSIGSWTFNYCHSLTNITISDSVTEIGWGAFDYCRNLTDIYYTGTEKQWSSINILGQNESLTNATIHFNYRIPGSELDSGTCGDSMTWAFYGDGTLVISGEGDMYAFYFDEEGTGEVHTPWRKYAEQIKSLVVEDGVTSIGSCAFYRCINLADVLLADSVEYIYSSSFEFCDFSELTLPENLKLIGDNAFSFNYSIEKLFIPENVNDIGENAFRLCGNLDYIIVDANNKWYSSDSNGILFNKDKTVLIKFPQGKTLSSYSIPSGVETIGAYAFEFAHLSTVNLPDSLEVISDSAFLYCENLLSIRIPDGVKEIEITAFSHCSSLTEIIIPSSVATVGEAAFEYCTSLANVVFEEGCKYISVNMFTGCENLKTVFIPSSLEQIMYTAFLLCEAITNVYYSGTQSEWNVIDIGDNNDDLLSADIHFSSSNVVASGACGTNAEWSLYNTGKLVVSGAGAMYNYSESTRPEWYIYADSITAVMVGDGITAIGSYALGDLPNLKNVYIADSVIRIESDAFTRCTALESVVLPEVLEHIGVMAFWHCDSLTDIYIPETVSYIGAGAFADCDLLERITVASGNKYYSSDATGVLFDKEKTILMQYPIGNKKRHYNIPDTVVIIDERTFACNEYLTELGIPVSVTSIGYASFYACNGLMSINYAGTQSQWESIDIGEANTALSSVSITYETANKGIITIRINCIGEAGAQLPPYMEAEFSGNAYVNSSVIAQAVSQYLYDLGYPESSFTIDGNSIFLIEADGSKSELTDEIYGTAPNSYDFEITVYVSAAVVASGTCGENVDWWITDTGKLVISGTGAMYDYLSWNSSSDSYDFTPRPWDEYIASITSVEVCSGITYIGRGAFTELYNIKTVSLPETVGEIGKLAFAACISLTGFTVDEDNPIFMADEDGVLYGREDMNAWPEEYRNEEYDYALVLFNYPIGNGVREYTVAENVYAVGDYAFAFCPTLEKITFPQTYLSLGEAVLSNCPALRTVTLNPLKLIDIDDNNYDWLEQCPELIYSIEADCGENVKSSLIINAKEESVCGTLTISGTGAMYGYDLFSDWPWYDLSGLITEIIIEDGVTTIGEDAFYGCSYLESITIPESVTSIGYRAFGYCDNLFDVYYGSSMDDWEKIAIDERNESLLSATIHTYECEHIVDQFSWETVKEPTCTPGLEIATCSVCGMRGGEKTVVCDSSTYPESAHNYDNNADQIWDFSYTGAKKLILKFSASTVTENGYDYIYIYDGNGYQIGKYCGTQLSGRKIIIEGSSFGIRLTSDGSVTQYGFSFDSVSARVDNELNKVIPAVAEHDWSGKDGICANGCGTECAHATNAQGVCEVCGRSCAELGHVFKFGKCSVCGKIGGTCGENLTWVIDKNTGTLTISGTGEMYDYTDSDAPWIMLWKSITDVIVEDGVTAIGDYAFEYCYNLTSATIPESVIEIGEGAFLECDSLTAINVDEANEEYCSVDGVLYSKDKTVLVCYPAGKADKEFTIPDTVKEIGAYAFAWCYNLETLTIPDSVTTIGDHAFYGSEFEIVSSFGGLTEIGDYAFAYCNFTTFDIPEGIETIGNYAFYDCYNLQSVTIPDSVTVIGSYAFSWCQNLQSAIIPDSVTAVGKGAFNQCSSLTKAEIGSGLKRIPQNMFESCYNLTEVEISEGVTDIGDYAFYDCDALKTVSIPASVTTIGTEAFDSCGSLEGFDVSEDNGSFCSENGVLFNKDKTVLICYPAGKTARNYTVPSTVTEILPYAFSGAANLRQITIPATVTTIGEYAFSYSGLMSVELENGITVINEYAFANCIKLESVSIPATVTSIEVYAFYRCSNLTDVYYYSTYENWNKIEIDSNNYHLDYPTIHYVDIQTEDYEFVNGELIVTGGREVATRFSNLDFAQDITKITVKGEVEQILEFVFADLPNVTEVNIAKTVSSIGNFAFENCPKLKTVNLDVEFEEESVEEETTEEPVCEISQENTEEYTSAVTGDIGELVLNAEAVDNTTTTRAYTTTTKPPTTTTAPTTTVAPTTTTEEPETDYTVITRVERTTTTRPYEEPEEDEYPSYRTIGIMAFAGCESLENIVIPETFKTIGNYAFADCTKLNSVTLNDGLKNIGSAAFNNCTSLSEITIPVSVKEMGYDAFYGCSLLETVYFNAVNCDITSASDDEKLIFGERDSLKNFYFGDKVHTIPYEILRGNSSITEIVIPDNVTYISSYAFYNCSALTKAVIGSGVEDMGNSVFSACDALTDVAIREGVTVIGENMFEGCNGLTSVTIPDSVTDIYSGALAGCYNLKSITIGKGLEYLHSYAFYYCYSLVSVTVDESNAYFASDSDGVLFSKDGTKLVYYPIGKPNMTYSIPEEVTIVGNRSFRNSQNLVSIGIPASVETIEEYALSMGDNLTDVYYAGTEEQWNEISKTDWVLPESTTLHFNSTVPDTDIASGTCGENLTWTLDANGKLTISGTGEMDDYTDISSVPWYSYSSSVTTVNIADNITSIADPAFFSCTNLTSITVDENNNYYSNDEYGVLFNNDKTELIQFPAGNTRTIYTIPDSVITIGAGAFYYCDSLTKIIIRNSVTTIGAEAFVDCTNLTSVTIPDSVTTIGEGAFIYCANITSVTIPDSVTAIGDLTFYACESLTSITIPDSVATIGRGAFYGCNNLADVYYRGTEEQWCKIKIDDANTYLIDATIHFAGRTVIDSGTCGDSVDWVLYEDGELVINGTGDMYNYTYLGQTPWAEYNDRIVEITVGEGVTSVGIGAFYGCSAVKSISLPSTVYNIRLFAFGACTALEEITVVTDNALFCSVDGVVYSKDKSTLVRYPAGKTATGFNIPDSVEVIGNEAFSESVYLESVIIPESVKKIDYHAFYSSQALKTVEISAGVEIIGNNVFDACYSLEAINVSADNAIYSSADGVLFNKTRTELIYYPAAKGTTYTIPDGVKTIKENAFLFSNVDTFVVPTSVTVIEAAQCKYGSANKTVHYSGTKAEWNRITIDSSEGLNDALINANVRFDGEKVEYETSNCKLSVKRPKVNEVNYGEVLIFEAVTNDLPEGAKIKWSVSGDISTKPIVSKDGMSCEVYAKGKGEVKVTATVVNAQGVPYQNVNGNIIKVQKAFTIKASFREIFIWILKSLFGATTVYAPETFF